MSTPEPPKQNTENDVKKPGLTFDWRDWEPYLECESVPDAQKREMIETLWQIVVAFVDLGFDLNPHQHTQPDGQESCGQTLDLKSVLEEAVLKSEATDQVFRLPNKPNRKEPTL